MLKYKILPDKSQPVLCVLTMMLCNVYSKFSETDLLPSHSLRLSMRNRMSARKVYDGYIFCWKYWFQMDAVTGAVAAWMWKWVFQWASGTVSRFTLEERGDEITSTVQNALLTVLLGRQCIWVQFHCIHKTQDGRSSISDNWYRHSPTVT